jgi:hypothetical protein
VLYLLALCMARYADSIDSSFFFKAKKQFSSFLNYFLLARLLCIFHWLHYHRCLGFYYIVHYELFIVLLLVSWKGRCTEFCCQVGIALTSLMGRKLYQIKYWGGHYTDFWTDKGIAVSLVMKRALVKILSRWGHFTDFCCEECIVLKSVVRGSLYRLRSWGGKCAHFGTSEGILLISVMKRKLHCLCFGLFP